jgi:hypothetical protein
VFFTDSTIIVILPGNDVPGKPMFVKEYRGEIARKYLTESSYLNVFTYKWKLEE